MTIGRNDKPFVNLLMVLLGLALSAIWYFFIYKQHN